jgi:hypothetical protein
MGQLSYTSARLKNRLNGIYGELYFYGATSQFDPATNDTPELFTSWADNSGVPSSLASSNTTPSMDNSEIVVSIAGTYSVTFSCSFTVPSGGAPTVKFYIYKDNGTPALVGPAAHRTISGASYGVVETNVQVALSAGDAIQVWVETTDATKNLTPSEAHLFLKYIGE